MAATKKISAVNAFDEADRDQAAKKQTAEAEGGLEATPSKARRLRSIESKVGGASEWIKYTDPVTNAFFFYNSSTNESRWEEQMKWRSVTTGEDTNYINETTGETSWQIPTAHGHDIRETKSGRKAAASSQPRHSTFKRRRLLGGRAGRRRSGTGGRRG